MALINLNRPVCNSIIFFILIMCVIIIVKPSFMYCEKHKKFKQFGFEKNQTVLCFPAIAIGLSIFLYAIFLFLSIQHK